MLDERMILGKTKNGVILSEVEGSRHALSLRRSVTTAAIACVLSLVCLSACTDYVEQMKDDFDDWEAERTLESSSSLEYSSSAALVAASATSDSAFASRRGIKESFSSLDELDVRVYAYQYDLYGLDFLHLYVENNEEDNLDSLTLRLYLEALPEEMEKCATLVDVDICQKIDSTGFSKPCERVDDLRVLMRYSLPMRLDNLKKSGESRYTYYIPVPLGILESHTRVRLDIGFSSGMSNDGYTTCETLRTTAKKRMSATSGDWSWSPHVAAEDGADYAGMPLEDIDYGDFVDNVIPVNPYVVVTRNEQYISGISPSFAGKKIVSSSSSTVESPFNPNIEYGKLKDSRDGQTYKTVKIGEQVWMAQNLNYETDSSSCYNDSIKYCDKYGRLYTMAAAKTACPSGWHLPKSEEWELLFTYVGDQNYGKNVFISQIDRGSDVYGFSALRAGYYGYGDFNCGGSCVSFWSSSVGDRNSIELIDGTFTFNDHFQTHRLSVRCLQDVTPKSGDSEMRFSAGSMTDSRDGQTYKTVKIGEQVWMAENRNFKTDSSFCYNNEESYCTKYGRLYRWAAAVGKSESECGYGKTCSLSSGNIQGVCPNGWHLPSGAEWETLFNAVGSQSTAGKELKSTSGWTSSGNGTDAFGFSALPAGFRPDDGYYDGEGGSTDLWSSTEYDSDRAFSMNLSYDGDGALLSDGSKTYVFSVRCLQD